MDRSDVDSWIDGYVRAWGTNDPEDIGAMFTDDARYYTAPYREPWAGRTTIVAEWIARKDQPGAWEFRYEVLGIDGELAFVRGWTRYAASAEEPEAEYSNLWVIRLTEDGKCSEFIEWWMAHA